MASCNKKHIKTLLCYSCNSFVKNSVFAIHNIKKLIHFYIHVLNDVTGSHKTTFLVWIRYNFFIFQSILIFFKLQYTNREFYWPNHIRLRFVNGDHFLLRIFLFFPTQIPSPFSKFQVLWPLWDGFYFKYWFSVEGCSLGLINVH